MKTNSGIPANAVTKNLHELVDQAAGNSIPTAVKRNSFIINEVPHEFQISSHEKILATIINKTLSTVVSHSKDSCIWIKATIYGDIICLSIKDKSHFSDNSVTEDLDEVKNMIKKLKGNVIIRNMEDKFTTILLSFPIAA